ncbi:hypothetical protein BKA70DRAFT_1239161 [Coprinopsis sp. MPI-PUGE-AT-0042]|nr:hypothetical protein BKA70DRAFT_1239161 [Coprinopsis sp. MPI-PUGE-AT-0042]
MSGSIQARQDTHIPVYYQPGVHGPVDLAADHCPASASSVSITDSIMMPAQPLQAPSATTVVPQFAAPDADPNLNLASFNQHNLTGAAGATQASAGPTTYLPHGQCFQSAPQHSQIELYCNNLQGQIEDLTGKVSYYKEHAIRWHTAYEREVALSQKLMETLMELRLRLHKRRRESGTGQGGSPTPSGSTSSSQRSAIATSTASSEGLGLAKIKLVAKMQKLAGLTLTVAGMETPELRTPPQPHAASIRFSPVNYKVFFQVGGSNVAYASSTYIDANRRRAAGSLKVKEEVLGENPMPWVVYQSLVPLPHHAQKINAQREARKAKQEASQALRCLEEEAEVPEIRD